MQYNFQIGTEIGIYHEVRIFVTLSQISQDIIAPVTSLLDYPLY